jgi:prepilin-type N-terminal cleavage/methylation domain-containing protein
MNRAPRRQERIGHPAHGGQVRAASFGNGKDRSLSSFARLILAWILDLRLYPTPLFARIPLSTRHSAGRWRERGFTLVEALIAMAILGTLGPALMITVGTVARSGQIADNQIQAEALIRSELDSILNAAFNDDDQCYPDSCYSVLIDVPSGFRVTVSAEALDSPTCIADSNCNTLQLVTVSVQKLTGDGQSKPVSHVSVYKAKR